MYKLIKSDIEDRKTWEDRQATAYKLRYGQIKRRTRPFPHAADYTWPLIDTNIERLKPAYVEQVLGPELIASFSSKNAQSIAYQNKVAQWFDWRVKKRSNFVKQIQHVIDAFLVGGKSFLKTFWDESAQRVNHQTIAATHCVVPRYTDELKEADRMGHIMHISKYRYERVAGDYGYNADPDFIKTIAGRGSETNTLSDARDLREGLGWHSKEDIIVLWEVYEQLADKSKKVWTFSPLHPEEEVRPPFTLPYNHKQFPIVEYNFEITDVGFYTPRGIAEILALYQSILKMLLDTEMDYIISCNRPVWMPAENAPPANYENFEMAPGQVLNSRLQALQFPTPPLDFTVRQQTVRSIAEQRIGAPDYGIGDQQQLGQGKKTATETNQLGAVKESGVNLHARVFGASVTNTLEQQWSLELQYKGDDLSYFYKREYQQLDDGMLKDCYELEPNGGKDGYSREKQIQKLLQIFQQFQGKPYFNEAEGCKEILENIDSDLVKTLFVAVATGQNQQMEEQANEIQQMINGFNPAINPEDDDMVHINTLEAGKKYFSSHPDKMLMPDVEMRLMQHEDAHIHAFHAKNPQGYQAAAQQLQKILSNNHARVTQIAQQMEQQLQAASQGAPQNGQGPPIGANGGGPPAAPVGAPQGPPVDQMPSDAGRM